MVFASFRPTNHKKWGQLSNIEKARNQILNQDPIPGSRMHAGAVFALALYKCYVQILQKR